MSDIKNLRFGVCDVCLKPICQCPKPKTPHALTIEQVVDKLVDKFLAWPLPDSVCSDLCATMQCYPHRSGTTLLAAHEARKMFEHVLAELFEDLAQQAQEIERLNNDVGMLRDEPARLKQQLAAMRAERDEAIDERDAYKAEMILMAAHQGIDNYQRLLDQLAASQATIDGLTRRDVASQERETRWQECFTEFKDLASGVDRAYQQIHALAIKEKLDQAQATMARLRECLERIYADTVLTRQSADYYGRIMGIWMNWIAEALRETGA